MRLKRRRGGDGTGEVGDVEEARDARGRGGDAYYASLHYVVIEVGVETRRGASLH